MVTFTGTDRVNFSMETGFDTLLTKDYRCIETQQDSLQSGRQSGGRNPKPCGGGGSIFAKRP